MTNEFRSRHRIRNSVIRHSAFSHFPLSSAVQSPAVDRSLGVVTCPPPGTIVRVLSVSLFPAAGSNRQWRRVAKQSLPRRSACLLRLSYVEAEARVDARVRQGEGAPRHICVFKTTGRLSRSMRRSPSAAPSGKQGTAAATGTTPPEARQRHPESLPDPC
jgi:hypothetical protein